MRERDGDIAGLSGVLSIHIQENLKIHIHFFSHIHHMQGVYQATNNLGLAWSPIGTDCQLMPFDVSERTLSLVILTADHLSMCHSIALYYYFCFSYFRLLYCL